MTFIENKYKKYYYAIVDNAKQREISGYVEKHHIIPRSLGGNNKVDNIVSLTAREHYICHLLLVRITLGIDKIKMQYAVGKFIQTAPGQDRKFTSWQYKKIRESISSARSCQTQSTETRQKISESNKGRIAWNKGKTGIIHSDESNRKRSATLSGKTLEDKVGIDRALQIKKNISESKIGKPSGMLGKTHPRKGTSGLWKMSEESKKNISNAKKGKQFNEEHLQNLKFANIQNGLKRRGQKQKIISCAHCGKIGGAAGINSYHNNNCKLKN